MATKLKPSQIPDFKRFAKAFAATANSIAGSRVQRFVDLSKDAFKERILDQGFDSFHTIPLSPVTIAKKVQAKVDLRVMIATHTYVNSIRSFTNRLTRLRTEYKIGFKPDAMARNYKGEITDIPLDDVAAVQEYGSASEHIPARPHWRVYRRVIRDHSHILRSNIKREIMRYVPAIVAGIS